MEELADISALLELENAKRRMEPSPVERLLNEFEIHEAGEEEAVERYRTAAAMPGDPVTRLVLNLIVADEERHRAVTQAMIATLKGSLNWASPEVGLQGEAEPGTSREELLRTTDELMRLEKSGIRQYKTLMKEARDLYHGTFEILLRSMVRDTEKHIELLKLLRKRLQET